ncbi:MAG: pimeloyl-ACP methyl ester carboxylesterase [Oleiphilaceae bacterium]|jgi:pimeloyl-ACP methyl ester carboxylesterase
MNKKTNIVILILSFLLSACGSTLDQDELIDKYSNAQSRFISLDGNRVHYRDEGKGDVIVLLHGTASSLHTWDAWVKQLSKEFRVIRMDLPGFSLTGPDHNHRYEVTDDIAFLNNFLSHLNLEKVHLAGSSLGGRIAWEFSLSHPEKVKTLTLMNSLGYPQKEWPPAIEIAQWPFMDIVMSNFSPRFLYASGLKEVYFDEVQVTDEVIDRYYELSRYPGNLDAFPRRVSAELDKNSESITKVSVPTLILWGKEDIYFPVENAYKFNTDIVGSTLRIYPNVGHLPMEEVPEKSLTDYLDFLQMRSN